MPAPSAPPYNPPPDRSGNIARIADLMGRQGELQAHASASRGMAVADLIGGVGQMTTDIMDRNAAAKKAAEAQAELKRLLMDPEGFDARAYAVKFGIDAATKAIAFIDAEKKAGYDEVEQRDPKKTWVRMATGEILREADSDEGKETKEWARVPDGQGGWIEGRYTDAEINRLGGHRPFSDAEKTRMIADAAAKAQIEDLEPLSARLIASSGLDQRAKGYFGRISAWAGLDDDVRFYQDARRAQATTLAARFQSGNMSEPDIDTWLSLIPDITKDTAGSARSKWAHIKKIVSGEVEPPGATGGVPDLPAAPPPPAGNPFVPTTPSMGFGSAVMPTGPGDFPLPPAPGAQPPVPPPGPPPGAPPPPPPPGQPGLTPAQRQQIRNLPPNAVLQMFTPDGEEIRVPAKDVERAIGMGATLLRPSRTR